MNDLLGITYDDVLSTLVPIVGLVPFSKRKCRLFSLSGAQAISWRSVFQYHVKPCQTGWSSHTIRYITHSLKRTRKLPGQQKFAKIEAKQMLSVVSTR